jgi:serpin B
MVVLLPRAVDGLARLEKSLGADSLASWLGRMHAPEVQLALPRFAMTARFQLNQVLAGLGMPSAFEPGRADFSGLDGTRELFLAAVVHKAFVDVNEEGTEAAAATGGAMALTAMPAEPIVFRADHPFVFLIRHRPTGSILFVGRVTDPSRV